MSMGLKKIFIAPTDLVKAGRFPNIFDGSGNQRVLAFSKILIGALAAVFAFMLTAFAFYGYHYYRNISGIEFSGQTIFVKEGGNLQAALDRARPGDTILLQAGATFKGAFKLPVKEGTEFITIRSAAAETRLPPPGTRIDPNKYAAVLPKLESNVKGEPVILAINGAHHYRFVGIEFGPTIEGLYNIIQLGTAEEKSVAELPHHIEFDRVWIHGGKTHGQRRGIAANGRNIKIENSHVSDIMRRGEESQAIAVWASDGPVEITNNYLEGAAENILFGGAGSPLKLIPTDCVVRGNHLNKPLEWREKDWVVKNLFEIKNGRRIRVENNLMTNNWAMGQDGIAIQITTRADSGPSDTIEDIEITGNIVRGAGGGINVYGAEGAGGHRLTVRNNVFADLDGPKWGSAGHFMKSTAWNGLTIENNTILQTGNITTAYGAPVRNFVFRNNIVYENEYGFMGDGSAPGLPTVNVFFPGAEISHNAIIGGNASRYRQPNVFVRSVDEIRFADPRGGDYRVRADSPLRAKGFKGGQIGADLDFSRVGQK